MRPGGDRNRSAVEAERQAEGRAAAAPERGERRGHDIVAALGEFATQAPSAARHDQSLAETDGVGREAAAVLDGDLDARLRRDPLADRGRSGRGEGARQIHDFAARQGSERRVYMVETGGGKFE